MRTPLFEEHVKLKAHIVDFHGWEMPLYYDQIIPEHMAVRKNVGIFDVSHMGDIIVTGKDSSSYLDGLFPTMVSKLSPGSCAYTAFTNEQGKMIDDCIVYRLSQEEYLIVPNAATKDKIYSWMKFNKGSFNINIDDISDKYGCIAVQGPKSQDLLMDCGLPQAEFFKWIKFEWKNHNRTLKDMMIISGTGYTGESGVEIIADNQTIVEIWRVLAAKLEKYEGRACGLGARDTLRMEKGMLLSGTDFKSDRTPAEAAISFIIDNSHKYIGQENIDPRPKEIFRGIVLLERGIPRTGDEIFIGKRKIGTLTSGSYSPSLARGIGLGFIERSSIKIGQEVRVNHAGKSLRGMISKPRMFPLEIPLPPS